MISLVLESRVFYLTTFTIVLQFGILPTIVGQYVRREKQQFFDFTECLMSFIMSSCVSFCSLSSALTGESWDECYWFHLGRHTLLAYLIAHSLFWVIHQKFERNTYMWLSHHLIAVLAMCMLSSPPTRNLLLLNIATLGMELSNPVNNLVFGGLHAGYSVGNSRAFMVLCGAWIIIFTGARIIPMPYVGYGFLDSFLLGNTFGECINRVAMVPLAGMYAGISIMNLYWFRQMMQGVWAVLAGGRSTEDTDLDSYKTK